MGDKKQQKACTRYDAADGGEGRTTVTERLVQKVITERVKPHASSADKKK